MMHELQKHRPLAWVNGSDAPEKTLVRLGYLPLSDAASLIVAATQGFAERYGLRIELHRQTSWSALRDRLLSGELDAAQGMYGLIYSMHLGIASPSKPMAVLMGMPVGIPMGTSMGVPSGIPIGITMGTHMLSLQF